MARYIDADLLREQFEDNDRVVGKATVRFMIDKAETVPAIVPVRCKDCVYDEGCPAHEYVGYSLMCYCSRGTRKGE